MSTFDSTGLVVDTQAQIRAGIVAKIEAKWGTDWRTDPESVTGQFVDFFAELQGDQNELILALSSVYRPGQSFGVWLSEIVKLNGIERKEKARTIVPIEVTASASGAELKAGDLVDTAGSVGPFELDNDVSIGASATVATTATCTKTGAIEVAAHEITEILTPRYGWDSVDNASAGITGNVEETDTLLKVRQKQAAEAVGTSSSGRLYDRLMNLENVEQVNIINNNTTGVDSYGVPEYSIWVIVYGGTDADIAETIYNVVGGVRLHGSETVNHIDSTRGLSREIKFGRSSDVSINVEVQTVKKSDDPHGNDYPTSGDDLMKAAIAEYFSDGTVKLGGRVARGDLYASAYEVPGHSVQDILISSGSDPVADSDVQMDPDERPTCVVGDITITAV